MNVQSMINRHTTGRRATLAGGAMLLALAASASSHAAIVVFLNPAGPGHYQWGDSVGGPNWILDVTLPASSQDGTTGSPSAYYHTTGSPSDVGGWDIPAQIHTGGISDAFLVGFNEGDSIPAAYAWTSHGFVMFEGFGSELPEGVETYLGIRFDLGDGYRHGWIGVVRTGFDLETFAWGYETTPGVAIAAGAGIPAPGALSLLALAGVTCGRRRRA
jgi:hypothetical protein